MFQLVIRTLHHLGKIGPRIPDLSAGYARQLHFPVNEVIGQIQLHIPAGKSHAHQFSGGTDTAQTGLDRRTGTGDVDGRIYADAVGQFEHFLLQLAFSAVDRRIRAHLPGSLQTLIHQIAGNHQLRAKGLAGTDSRQSNRTAAADQYCFPGHFGALHAMNACTHGFKQAGRLIGDVVIQQKGIFRGDLGVFRESAVFRCAEKPDVFADVRQAVFAEPARSAGDMRLTGDAVPHLAVADIFADFHNVSRRLMAGNQRRFHPRLGPLVPLHDVEIRSAHRGAMDFDEHFIVVDLWNRQIGAIDEFSRGRGLLDKTTHGSFQGRLPLIPDTL